MENRNGMTIKNQKITEVIKFLAKQLNVGGMKRVTIKIIKENLTYHVRSMYNDTNDGGIVK